MEEANQSDFLECDRRYTNSYMKLGTNDQPIYKPCRKFDSIASMRAETTRKIDALEAKLADQEKTIVEYREAITIMHDAIQTLQIASIKEICSNRTD